MYRMVCALLILYTFEKYEKMNIVYLHVHCCMDFGAKVDTCE